MLFKIILLTCPLLLQAHSPIDTANVLSIITPSINEAQGLIAKSYTFGNLDLQPSLDAVVNVLARAVNENPALVKRRSDEESSVRIRAANPSSALVDSLSNLVNSLVAAPSAKKDSILPFLSAIQAILDGVTDVTTGTSTYIAPFLNSSALSAVIGAAIATTLVPKSAGNLLGFYGLNTLLSNLFGSSFANTIFSSLLAPNSLLSSIISPKIASQLLNSIKTNQTEIPTNSTLTPLITFLSGATLSDLQNSTAKAINGFLVGPNSTVGNFVGNNTTISITQGLLQGLGITKNDSMIVGGLIGSVADSLSQL